MDGQAIMALLKDNLTAAMPDRIVTRTAMDFAQRPAADIAKGVMTLMSLRADNLKAPRALQDHAGALHILLLGEFKLAENASGEDVEVAEWALWQEVKTFFDAPGLGLCPLDPIRVTLSQQRDVPYGWIGVEATYAELD